MSSPSEFRGLSQATDADLPALLERSADEPVLLYFSTTWCGPCRVFGPRLQRYVDAHPDLVAVKIDGDENEAALDACDVDSFPHVSVLRHGAVQWAQAGDDGRIELEDALDALVSGLRDAPPSPPRRRPATPISDRTLDLPDLSGGALSVRLTRDDGSSRSLAANGAERVELSPGDRLDLQASWDGRRARPFDLSAAAHLAGVPFDLVVIDAVRLEARELAHLAGIAWADDVWVSAAEPLDADAQRALANVPTARMMVTAPGVDSAALAGLMPGVRVNGIATSAAAAAALAPLQPPTPAAPRWTDPDGLRRAVSSGEPVRAMVQAEHPADVEVAADWHRAVADGAHADALTVSAYGDACLVAELSLEARHPALVDYAGGVLVRRRDIAADASATGAARPDERLRAWPSEPARTIVAEATAGERIGVELVAPGSVVAMARFVTDAGVHEAVPAGATVRVQHQLWSGAELPLAALRAAGVQDLRLQVVPGDDEADLSGLAGLPDLAGLDLDAGPLTDRVIDDVLPRLSGLRRVRLAGADDDQRARARATLPHAAVDGAWPGTAVDPTEEDA